MHRLHLNHLKHVTGSRYAPWCSGPCASVSHSAGTLGFDRACIRRSLSGPFGSHPHSHSVDHLLEHLHSLFSLFCLSCVVTLSCFVNSFACCWLSYCFMGSWLPIPGCFTFFTAIWRVFHSTKSNDFNANFSFGIIAAVHSMEPAQF